MSSTAFGSIERVLAAHAPEIIVDLLATAAPATRRLLRTATLENKIYNIDVTWVFNDGTTLAGPSLNLDELADRFPDCSVAI